MEGSAPHPWPGRRLTSLILPAFNPGARLLRTLHELRCFLDDAPGSWEVVFVCDGCTDGTSERLQQLARADGWLRVVDYQPNRGKGYAVRRGLAAARGAWRVFTDVDLAYPPSDILRVAQQLWQGADVVIGSRCHPDSRAVLPPRLFGYALLRQVQSHLFGWLARAILPLPYRDTQAGLKGFSAAAVRQLLPHLRCNGFGFDCEMLAACARLGLKVTEMPVCVRLDGAASTTGWRAGWATLRELWQVRLGVASGEWRVARENQSLLPTPHSPLATRRRVPL